MEVVAVPVSAPASVAAGPDAVSAPAALTSVASRTTTTTTRRRRRARRRNFTADPDQRGRSHLSNKTACDRVQEYGDDLFRSTGQLLVCQFCDKPVDPRRRSSIEYHLKSFSHQRMVRQLVDGIAGSPHSDDTGGGSGGGATAAGMMEAEVGSPDHAPCMANLPPIPPILLPNGEAMKVDILSPGDGAPPPPPALPLALRAGLPVPDWGALFGGGGPPAPSALSQMALLMAEGAASSLCEAQLGEGGASPPRDDGADSDGRCCCHCTCSSTGATRCVRLPEGNTFPNELVVKVRLADTGARHFVLVEVPSAELTLHRLVANSCAALSVPVKRVKDILKLPNTLLKRDKDVARLINYQELELMLYPL